MRIKVKNCKKCGLTKSVTEFYKRKPSKDGIDNKCKKCDDKANEQWRENNPEKVKKRQKRYRENNPDKIKKRHKQWRDNNPEKVKKQHKQWLSKHPGYEQQHNQQWYLDNVEYAKKSSREYGKNNKEKVNKTKNKRHKIRYKNDPGYRMILCARARNRQALKYQGVKKSLHLIEGLGCTKEFFQNYFYSLFTPGMTKENNGKRKWVQHHPKKLSSFDLSKIEEQKKAFHYTNIVPMWEDEHREWHKKHGR